MYFETSALNYAFNEFSIENAYATQIQNQRTGIEFLISPVTLWELLLTNNNEKKEKKFFFAQHYLSDYLLPSPSDIIAKYFIGEVNRFSNKEFDFHFEVDNNLNNVWNDIVNNKKKTILVEDESYDGVMKKANFVRDLSKNIKVIIESECEKTTELTEESSNLEVIEYFINLAIRNNEIIREKISESDFERKSTRLALFFICIFVIFESDLYSSSVQKMWLDMGITEVEERIRFVISSAHLFIDNSPFKYMAGMCLLQSSYLNERSRGLIFDCMHILYLNYTDFFFTEDHHILEFKKMINPVISDKIRKISEVKISVESFSDEEYIEILNDLS